MKILVNGQSGTIGKYISSHCTNLTGDLKTTDQLANFKKQVDSRTIFIHLAGIVGNSLVESDKVLSNRINVKATQELGEAAFELGIKKFIYVSSSHVYGNYDQIITEDSQLNPMSLYASQKLEGENVLREIFSTKPESLLIVRVFSILDFGMPRFTLGGAIENLIANPNLSKISNADDVRDFLTPRSVARNLELIAKTDISGIYNLCSGIGKTIADATIAMALSKGVSVPFTAFIHNPENKTTIIGDNSKIKKAVKNLELNWNLGKVN